VIPRAFSLTESCYNDVAKYNALLIGMQLAKEIGVKNLEVFGDSKLIVNQVRGGMKSDMKTWCPITTQPFTWQRSFKASILTMYHVSKMRM